MPTTLDQAYDRRLAANDAERAAWEARQRAAFDHGPESEAFKAADQALKAARRRTREAETEWQEFMAAFDG